jgi:hypothetical protein
MTLSMVIFAIGAIIGWDLDFAWRRRVLRLVEWSLIAAVGLAFVLLWALAAFPWLFGSLFVSRVALAILLLVAAGFYASRAVACLVTGLAASARRLRPWLTARIRSFNRRAADRPERGAA